LSPRYTYATLTPEEKKAREQEQILASDLQNAEDLFASSALDDKNNDEEDPLYMKPTGPKDFKVHGEALIKHLTSLQHVKGFTIFWERVLKGVCADLSIDDVNSLSSVLKVLVNTKQQEQRKKDGVKKKSKRPALQVFIQLSLPELCMDTSFLICNIYWSLT